MLIAIMAGVLTGLIWTLVGVVFKYLASTKQDAQKYFLLNYFFMGLFGLILFSKFDVLLSGEVMSPLKLITVFGLSGCFNYLGLFFMQRGMKYGHGGVVWAIGQSALMIPFLAGIIIFKQTGSIIQYIGLMSIICGMIIPALAGRKNSSEEHKESSFIWFFLAVLSMLFCGTAQTFANVPSYWAGWVDNAQLRPGLGAVFSFFTVLIIFFIQRKKIFPIARKLVVIALAMSLVMLLSMKILFFSLDRLAFYDMGAIGYPIVVGSCITGFSLYSMFIIKEKVLWQNWVGLIGTIAGIIIISL